MLASQALLKARLDSDYIAVQSQEGSLCVCLVLSMLLGLQCVAGCTTQWSPCMGKGLHLNAAPFPAFPQRGRMHTASMMMWGDTGCCISQPCTG